MAYVLQYWRLHSVVYLRTWFEDTHDLTFHFTCIFQPCMVSQEPNGLDTFYSMQHFILHTHCLTTKGLQMWSGRWDDCINTRCKTWAIRAQRRNTCLCSSNSSAPLSVIKELRASALILWLQPRIESLRIKSNKMNQRTCPVTATCARVLAAADGDSFAV